MPLFKHRPKILLRAPAEVHPGQTFEVEVILDARRDVELRFVDLELTGVEQATIGGGGKTMTQRSELVSLQARLLGSTRLPVGRRRLRWSFTLPETAPPSYRGESGGMEYALAVHAAIPWWPGVRERFELKVRLLAAPEEVEEPLVFSSAPGGPRGRELWVEGSLTSSVVAAGRWLRGAVALGNVAHHRLRSLHLSLVAEEAIQLDAEVGDIEPDATPSARISRLEARRLEVELPLPDPLADGQSLPFSLELPSELPLSYAAHRWRLSWALEVVVRLRWGRDLRLRVPVKVQAAPARPGRPPRLAPPRVGAERLEALWSGVAAELGLSFEGGTLRGSLDDVAIEVDREHRGRRGIFLIATLTYPSLEIGLQVEPASFGGRLIGRGFEIGDERFDRLQRVGGREAEQVRAILRMLLSALDPFLPIYWMDDLHLRVELRDAGQRAARLRRLAQQLLRLGREVLVARASIPPPRAAASRLAEWRDLAAKLGGRLQSGSMSIEGTYEGMSARVVTRWTLDGRPEFTEIALQPATSLMLDGAVDVHGSAGELAAHPEIAALAGRLSGGAAQQLERLLVGAQRLRLATDTLALELEAPLPAPLDAWERLGALARLARGLRPAAGPYR